MAKVYTILAKSKGKVDIKMEFKTIADIENTRQY